VAWNNEAKIIGFLPRDPELRNAGGFTIATFGVGIARKTKGVDDTLFLNVTAFGELGAMCAASFHKGDKVKVVGRFDVTNYEDKAGTKRLSVKVLADSVELDVPPQRQPVASGARDRGPQRTGRTAAPSHDGSLFDDEDIPF
jgi:single-stranded DNA-binding protein